MARISYIISAYNEQRRIKRALSSVINQTFTDIEIIVVNDASTDATASIVADIAKTDSRVSLITHERNMGLSATRVTGVNHAAGDYVTFVDADDEVEPFAAELLLSRAIETNADVVMMGSRRVTRNWHIKLSFFTPSRFFEQEKYFTRELLPYILRKQGLTLNLWDKLYRRDLLLQNIVAEDRFMGEDMLTNIRVFNSSATLAWVDYVGYNWTTGGGSDGAFDELWHDNKILYCRCREVLASIEAANEENLQALDDGIVNSFIDAISRQMVNTLRSKRKIREWIEAELSQPFWTDYNIDIPYNDTEGVFDFARRHFIAHRRSYVAMSLLR